MHGPGRSSPHLEVGCLADFPLVRVDDVISVEFGRHRFDTVRDIDQPQGPSWVTSIPWSKRVAQGTSSLQIQVPPTQVENALALGS
jgi:hypothetical protein